MRPLDADEARLLRDLEMAEICPPTEDDVPVMVDPGDAVHAVLERLLSGGLARRGPPWLDDPNAAFSYRVSARGRMALAIHKSWLASGERRAS